MAAFPDRFRPLGSVRNSAIGLMVGLSSLWLLAITVAVRAEDAPSDPVVARMDGAEIRESDLALAEKDLGPNFKPKDASARRHQLVTYVTDMILAERLSEAEGITSSPEFKRRYALMRRKISMEMLLDRAAREAQTDAALHAAYQQFADALKGEPEIRTRHILFKTNPSEANSDETAHEKAIAAVSRLRNGEEFAAVETAAGPGVEGGEVGFGAPIPDGEYAAVAHGLRMGEVSDPVKTKMGWYVIKLEELRSRPVPSFESMQEQLGSYVARQAQLEFLNQLRANAHIQLEDEAPTP